MFTRMRRTTVLAVGAMILAATGFMAGCGSTDADGGTAVTSVDRGDVALVGPAAFEEAMEQPGAVILDVRTPAEFLEGHLPGAINIDVSDPSFAQRVDELDPSVPYAVYCRTANRSATATAYMSDHGFSTITELDGGIVAWANAKKPVVAD